MHTYQFLYQKTLRTRVRKLVRKPAALIYTIFIVGYFIWLAFMLNDMMQAAGFANSQNLSRILCAFTLYLTPANFAAYAKRKGLIFLPGDVHFLFVAPMHPKAHLLYVYGKNLLPTVSMTIFLILAGVFWFHVSWMQMLLYGIVCVFLDVVMQGAIIILLYGNEKMSKRGNQIFSWLMYGIIASFVAVALWIFYRAGKFDWMVLLEFFDGEWIGMIPLIGWSLAAMRLFILGPTTIRVVCTALYLISIVVLVVLSWKMQCTGEYYEEAMKFADDYQEARKKGQSGEVAVVGRKKKYKTATVSYKKNGASAIFYRQLLEYKKEKFFIFSFATLLYLGIGLGIAYLGFSNLSMQNGISRYYVVPGVMAYLSFLMSGYKTRWGKELDNPYVFLIPESPFKKMWYATVIDHIRAGIHGLLLVVPAVVGLKLEIWCVPVFVFLLVCINAVGLYSRTVCDVIFGSSMGDSLKRTLHMLLYLFAILLAIVPAVIVTLFFGTMMGILAVSVYAALLAGLMAWAGSVCFARMER